jgi:hypothetical protein
LDTAKLNRNFQEDETGFTLDYGKMEVYHAGLEGFIGNPDPDIEWAMIYDHYSCSFQQNFSSASRGTSG